MLRPEPKTIANGRTNWLVSRRSAATTCTVGISHAVVMTLTLETYRSALQIQFWTAQEDQLVDDEGAQAVQGGVDLGRGDRAAGQAEGVDRGVAVVEVAHGSPQDAVLVGRFLQECVVDRERDRDDDEEAAGGDGPRDLAVRESGREAVGDRLEVGGVDGTLALVRRDQAAVVGEEFAADDRLGDR